MRIAITGASGLLGFELVAQALNRQHAVIAGVHSSRPEFPLQTRLLALDLTVPKSVDRFVLEASADWIIHTAAMTDVDRCEQEPRLAFSINAQATANLMAATAKNPTRIAYLSTDYVFDGTSGPYSEDDSPNPINVYGKSKLEGEAALRSAGPQHLIIRSAGFLGHGGDKRPTFVTRMLYTMKTHPPLLAPHDQISNITPVGELAIGILNLLEKGESGIWHIAHPELLSRFELALLLARCSGISETAIRPVAYSSLHRPAPRPLNGGLRTEKVQRTLGSSFRPIERSVRELLNMSSSVQ